MIVQCEQCSTRFKLDDSKVREEGVKVRCSKCRHIFIVNKVRPEQGEDADFDTLLSGLIAAPHIDAGATAKEDAAPQMASPGFPEINETPVATLPPVAPLPESAFNFGDLKEDFSVSSFEFEPEQQIASDESALHVEGSPFDALQSDGETKLDYSSDISFGALPDDTEINKAEGMADEFAQLPVPDEMPKAFSTFGIEGKEEGVEAELPEGISADGVLSTEETSPDEAGITKKEIDSPAPISWDFEVPASDLSGVEPVAASVEIQETASEPMITKSDPNKDTPFQESQKYASPSSVAADDEPSPLAIVSRKRSSSLIPAIVTVISVLVIIALASMGFFFLNKDPASIEKFGLGALVSWIGLDKGEEGSITIRNATSEFLKNKEAGEIFVIRGEAVNAFRKPRASIQVKATLYGAKGAVVGSRTSYCGNPQTKEQLATLPLAKIEAAMGNQFGDSLANIGVQPGKAIPFVIVLTNVPTDASEFGLEIVGSTVASQ